jgi:hypothetical protein
LSAAGNDATGPLPDAAMNPPTVAPMATSSATTITVT